MMLLIGQEQGQEQLIKLPCAWCLAEQGLPMGEGSHGACKKHAEELYDRYLEARQQRARKNQGESHE